MCNKKSLIIIVCALIVFFCGLAVDKKLSQSKNSPSKNIEPTFIPTSEVKTGQINLPTKTTTQINVIPTKAPTSISQKPSNFNIGPCIKVNVLMYHHIQGEDLAKSKKQTSLTVTPDFFRKHLQYLKDHGYEVIGPEKLIGFFNGTEKLGPKLAMITWDDGYEDNFLYAYPILKEFGDKAVLFTATGLVENPDYLKWDQINQMKDLVYFANHTWSHHGSSGSKEELDKEISLADKQLSDRGLNNAKVFAYPYGKPSATEEEVLKKYGYNLAFTTTHGTMMCKGNYLELPRIRVGNAPLSSYGL